MSSRHAICWLELGLLQGVQSESLPYVYYSPSYGYAESPYNPYNPYIPGAMIGVEGPFVGAQQYYPLSPYHNSVSSPAYIPILVQSDVNSPEALSNPGAGTISRPDARGLKNNVGSASTTFSRNSTKNSSNPANSLNRPSDSRENVGQGKPAVTYGSVSSSSVSNSTSSRVFQVSAVSCCWWTCNLTKVTFLDIPALLVSFLV